MKQTTKTITAVSKVKKEMRLVEQALLKQRSLYEFYISSKLLDEPNFRPEKPWRDSKAESVLKALGAGAFRLGINPHGYELDVPDSVTHKEDRLWFNSDGTVFSTNAARTLGYVVDPANKTITLWNEEGGQNKEAGFKVGVIKKLGTSAVFVSSGAGVDPNKKEEPAEERSEVLDWIQTAMDWLGLIPGIGDILDIINAALYFVRAAMAETDSLYQEFLIEGFLSLIAIIPIVGSAIKLGVKEVYKGGKALFRLIDSARSANKAIEWEKLVESGAISLEQLADLGSGLKWVAGEIKVGAKWLDDVPGIPAEVRENILKELDDFADWVALNGRHVDELGGLGKANKIPGNRLKPAVDAAADAVTGTVNKIGFVRRFGRTVTLGIFPKLKKSLWFPEKKLKYIAKALEKRFADKMADPTMLTALIKTMPNDKLIKSMNQVITDRISNLPVAEKKALMSQLTSTGAVKRIKSGKSVPDIDLATGKQSINPRTGKPILVPQYIYAVADDIPASTLDDVFRVLQNDKAGAGMYSAIKDNIVKDAVSGNSPLWNAFMSDKLTNLKTVLSTDMIPKGKEIFRSLEVNFAKNVDVMWNELQEFREDMDWKNPEDVNGVFLPLMQMGVKEFAPGTYDDIKVFRDEMNKTLGKVKEEPLVQAVDSMLTDKSKNAYNPSDIGKGSGGKYK